MSSVYMAHNLTNGKVDTGAIVEYWLFIGSFTLLLLSGMTVIIVRRRKCPLTMPTLAASILTTSYVWLLCALGAKVLLSLFLEQSSQLTSVTIPLFVLFLAVYVALLFVIPIQAVRDTRTFRNATTRADIQSS